jgi:hypothetical protein
MTGRHAANPFDITEDQDQRWPFIISAAGRPVVRVADADTAAYTEDQAVQAYAEGWTASESVFQPLQDASDLTEGTDWIAWWDWEDQQDAEA